jgi:sugar/nucleoside kinase (ribokinase family)
MAKDHDSGGGVMEALGLAKRRAKNACFRTYGAMLPEVRSPEDAAAALDAEVAAPGVLDDLCARATPILSSETRLAHDGGGVPPDLALRVAQRTAPHAFVGVTLGEHGIYGLENAALRHEPALPVNVVDTQGAYVLARVEGATASMKCEAFRGRWGAPTRAQVHARLAAVAP